ncbi:MAG: hypothetical protein GF331_22605 [Chitinivibrionales bacterium]|nr:hypothetical protein [Chitinivibrionales bacterium]
MSRATRGPRLGFRAVGTRLVLTAVAVVWLNGCLTSSVRYRRPSGAVVTRNAYRVPRNWDYRKDYRIPVSRLRSIVDSYLGVPYRYGGTDRRGLDCSGLVYVVFRKLNRARMPRSTRRLKRLGRPVQRAHMRPGDLLFFATGRSGRINHVGIYMGDKRFAHASASKGVIYSDVHGDYYEKHFVFARRIF